MMKKYKSILLALSLFLILSAGSRAQSCVEYHMVGDCIMDRQKGFSTYSQSKSAAITAKDTIEFNMVFYGQKDYMFSFCTHRKFYPINFKILDAETREELYDNKADNYIESLGIGFDVTKSLIIQIHVLAREATEEEIEDYVSCIGLLLQYKNYPERKVKLSLD